MVALRRFLRPKSGKKPEKVRKTQNFNKKCKIFAKKFGSNKKMPTFAIPKR